VYRPENNRPRAVRNRGFPRPERRDRGSSAERRYKKLAPPSRCCSVLTGSFIAWLLSPTGKVGDLRAHRNPRTSRSRWRPLLTRQGGTLLGILPDPGG